MWIVWIQNELLNVAYIVFPCNYSLYQKQTKQNKTKLNWIFISITVYKWTNNFSVLFWTEKCYWTIILFYFFTSVDTKHGTSYHCSHRIIVSFLGVYCFQKLNFLSIRYHCVPKPNKTKLNWIHIYSDNSVQINK